MILDTDFLIDLMRGKADAVQRQQLMTEGKENCKVAAATVFELWVGVALSSRSQDEKAKIISALSAFDAAPMTGAVAEKAGELHGSLLKSGNSIGVLDSMIAATALLSNEPLLTGNAGHFARVKGLRIENY